jgi:signal transduction histidine kinase
MIASAGFWTVFPIAVAAVVSIGTAMAGVVTWFVNGVRAERARLQKLYADAYSAVVSYQEFPYVIRRRRAPTAGHEEIGGEERLRISDALHTVQQALNNYLARSARNRRPSQRSTRRWYTRHAGPPAPTCTRLGTRHRWITTPA